MAENIEDAAIKKQKKTGARGDGAREDLDQFTVMQDADDVANLDARDMSADENAAAMGALGATDDDVIGGSITVTDTVDGRDGTDNVIDFEHFNFADQDMDAMYDGEGSWAGLVQSDEAMAGNFDREGSWVENVAGQGNGSGGSGGLNDDESDNPLGDMDDDIGAMSDLPNNDDQSGSNVNAFG